MLRVATHAIRASLVAVALAMWPQLAVAQPMVSIEAPAQGALTTPPFAISGWAVDYQAVATTGIDAVAIYTGSMAAPVLLGYATFEQRPDVAAYFGRPGYLNAGYRFTVPSLPSGNQQLGIMVHSTVTNAWSGPYVRDIVVPAAPIVTIDTVTSPTQPIALRGLAGDFASTSGPGVNSVEIWADPSGGGASIFVGLATLGLYRPDAAVYGPQYLYSGYERVVRGIPPGSYTFRARALSSVTGLWGQTTSASVAVVNDPRIYVQSPANNATVTAPVSVIGAVADLATASGTGMSAVHVYVRPVGTANSIFAGAATPNIARPDLQPYVGYSSQFLNIGFQIDNLPIPPGSYDLLTYAFSTVSNAWTVAVTRITVLVPAATPVMSPPSGEYATPITVTGSSSTPGAILRFTVDGTDPIETSAALPASVIVAGPGSGKIRAFAQGYLPSATASVTYTFRTGAPAATPSSGTYEGPIQFSASTVTPGATIRFTTDGTDPTETSAELGGVITLSSSVSAKMRAYRQGWPASAITTVAYTIVPARPTFTVGSGTYDNVQTVAMQTATPNGQIRYTTNGNDPTVASTLYTGPLSLPLAVTIRARTFDSSGASSPVSVVAISYAVAPVTLQPAPGTYTNAVSVFLVSSTAHAVVRYTLDGSTPNASSPTVANGNSVLIDSTRMLLAQPFVAGWPTAAVAGGMFTLKAPTPSVVPDTGTYARPFSVSVSPPPAGGIIRYTTDGTTPTSASLPWGGLTNPPNGVYQFTFAAFVNGWATSDPVTRTYTIVDSVAPTPTLNPPPGDHAIGVSVTIAVSDPGATIRFTTDGSVPSATSAVYTAPITLSTPTTVRARAFKANAVPSNLAGGLYRLKLQSPAVNPPAGTYSFTPTLSITHPTLSVSLRYTTNRREPDDSSPLVPTGSSIPIVDGRTVKVRAFLSGWAPSDSTTNTYFLTSSIPLPSNSVFSENPPDGTVVATGSPLVINVSGTPLVPATVRVTRNGADVTSQFSVTATSLASSAAVLAGATSFEVTAMDATGAPTGTTILLTGVAGTFLVTVRDQGGVALSGSAVTLTDASGMLPAQYAISAADGTATLRAGPGFAGVLTVQNATHHTYVASVSGTSATAVMSAKTENFERGLSEWSISYLLDTRIRPHIEGLAPWFCYINCGSNALFASDTTDNDMIVGTFQSPLPVTVSRVFRFEPGSRVASIRYRFFSHVPTGWYRMTATVPSTGAILGEHVTTMANLQGAGQASPGTQNLQSAWLTLAAQLPTNATEVRITVSLPADTNPGYTATWIEIDRTQLQGVQLGAPDLRDVHQPNTTRNDPLRYISLGHRNANSGRTEIWGSLAFSGTPGTPGTPPRTVSSVFLDVKNASDKAVRTSVALDPLVTGLINTPFPANGLLTSGSSRRLFEFTDAQMQVFNTTSEERLLLTIRATDNNGTPIPVMGENEKSVIKLTDIRNGVTRYSDRDPGQCRDKNVDLPWPCRGDAWGRSKLQDAILAAQNSLSGLSPAVALQTNDISNINGGYFPPHGTHRLGDAVDMDVAGYDNLDAAVARTMVKIGQALADAANGQQITLRRILVGYEENGPFHEELQKPEHLIGGVQAALIIRRDTRGGHRDHFHAEFTVPNP